MWQKADSSRFQQIFASFASSKKHGALWRSDLFRHIEKQDVKLAKKFLHFARHTTTGRAVVAAVSCRLCGVCKDAFLGPFSNTCADCRKTDAGKEYSRQAKIVSALAAHATEEKRASINAKKRATSLKNFGTEHPRQNKEQSARHSKTLQSSRSRRKREATCLSKWGVKHHSQHPEVLAKILRTAFQNKQVTVQGKSFVCQGYEPFVLRRLVRIFGAKNIVGQFDEEFIPIELEERWFTPDFFIRNKRTYVEVKSAWTLGIRGNKEFLKRNRQKQQECNAIGVWLKFIVYNKERDRCVQLPKEWFKWSSKQLKHFVRARTTATATATA